MPWLHSPLNMEPLWIPERDQIDDRYLDSGGSASRFDKETAAQLTDAIIAAVTDQTTDLYRDWWQSWGDEFEGSTAGLLEFILHQFGQLTREHIDGWRQDRAARFKLFVDHVEHLILPPDNIVICSAHVQRLIDATEDLMGLLKQRPTLLLDLPPRRFEFVIADLLRNAGFDVETTQASHDYGVDVYARAWRDGRIYTTLVQCKRYTQPNSVGIEVVQRLYGQQMHERAETSMVATTSYFTKTAQEWVRDKPMRLYDIRALRDWLRAGKAEV